jgi:hypothetical protein
LIEKKDLKALITRLLDLGFEEAEDEGDGVIQRFFDRVYRGYRVPVKFKVDEEHLSYFEEEKTLKKEYKQIGPCWLLGENFAELLLHTSGEFSKNLVEHAISEWGNIKFAGEIEAIIGEASSDFIGYYRFNPEFITFLGNLRPEEIVKTNDLSSFFVPPLTMRISFPKNSAFSKEKILKIADTCLFHVADVSHISIKLALEWEPSGERLIFSQGGINPPENMVFPKSLINRELVNFYTRAINGNVPEYQFLGFYHCLEYFFLAVSDNVLYQRIKTHLLNPSFSVTDNYIDKIVVEIHQHRSEENEVVMLRQVLQKYISKNELERFINSHETIKGKKVYTESHEILGKTYTINPLSKNIFELLAQRIKHIRNEIVHSENRRQRSKQRWVELESISIDELPLMRFLAQQVISGTSKPLE